PWGSHTPFAARSRNYPCRLTYGRIPLDRHFPLTNDPVDLGRLNEASQVLLGERDFTAFCKARPGATAIRTLQEFRWEPWQGETGANGARAWVRADAFCHNMVRSLVGATLAVGTGRRTVQWLREVAASAQRSSQVHVAPAHPLILEGVGYPQASELGARARQARAVRTLPGSVD